MYLCVIEGACEPPSVSLNVESSSFYLSKHERDVGLLFGGAYKAFIAKWERERVTASLVAIGSARSRSLTQRQQPSVQEV